MSDILVPVAEWLAKVGAEVMRNERLGGVLSLIEQSWPGFIYGESATISWFSHFSGISDEYYGFYQNPN
ncbi:hypothetical protein RCJ22_18580 [Vibrio sp. FNV 38]|nr:hypothetical protein [Vibrio sp. FNV 38]